MLPEKRTNTNVGVGMGFLLQLAGLFLAQTGDMAAILALVLILISIPVFIWGCMNYAEGKGHSKWVGLVGLAGIIGLIVLIVLPDQDLHGPGARAPLGATGVSSLLGASTSNVACLPSVRCRERIQPIRLPSS